MNITVRDNDDVLEVAFARAKEKVISGSPAIGLLGPESHLWKLVRRLVSEGHASGITDPEALADFAQSSLPKLRKIHHR